jgi:hypothetical protein
LTRTDLAEALRRELRMERRKLKEIKAQVTIWHNLATEYNDDSERDIKNTLAGCANAITFILKPLPGEPQ